MKIEMFPAKSGDAFLVSFGKQLDNHLLIDGGFKETYDNYIKERLSRINKKNQNIKLVVVTHIDQDHIGGILKLFEQNGLSSNPKIVKVDEIWHNSYRHLQFKYKDEIVDKKRQDQILKDIVLKGSLLLSKKDKKISSRQGSMLASYILQNGYKWNKKLDNKAIKVNRFQRINLADDLKIILLSPYKESLEKLKKCWEIELRKKKYDFNFSNSTLFDDAYEFFLLRKSELDRKSSEKKISYQRTINFEKIKEVERDKSITNESSLAFIIEYKDKKLLFLGDAFSNIINNSLKELKRKENYNLDFDLIKLSHHGSLANLSVEFIKNVNSKKWLISGNGKHDNPDIDSIKLILKLKKEIYKEFYFNYTFDWIEPLKNEKLMREFNYKIFDNTELKTVVVDI